jgi:hypothetical protein
MENNRRGNKQMQSAMHELSHGSNSSKKRFGIKEAAAIVLLYAITINSPVYVPMIISLGLFLYYSFPKNEPKTENKLKMTYTPEYRLTQLDAICMIRNAKMSEPKSKKR